MRLTLLAFLTLIAHAPSPASAFGSASLPSPLRSPATTATTATSLAAADLPSPEESAKALQDYMVKSQEDKLRAVQAVEEKSKSRIQELEAEVAELKAKLESPTVGGVVNSAHGSFEFPATNKAMTEKVASYQAFVADYLVRSSQEKVEAVKAAEDKLRASYEEKLGGGTTSAEAPQKHERGSGYGVPLDDISEAVGNTPLVKISDRLAPDGVTIYAKCEFFNPLSSVKDRLALSIIETAEREGKLKPGDTVVEATSGNTGIAVAMMCAQRGYDCVITMAEPFSVERRKLMRMLGAKVIVTPKAGKGTGMVEKAAELAEAHGWFLCHQFETDANWKFHEATTGPEIVNDIKAAGAKLDYWVTGYGTGGTYHGAGKYIKANSPDTKIVLAEPGAAALIDSGIQTERKADGSPAGSHPAFAAHPIQGWAPDFIPLVLEKGMSLDLMDEYVQIPDGAAVEMAQALAKKEGILTGISGGATMYAAIETAKKAPKGSTIVAMLPDTGERYLSTPLFGSIDADMNEEELEIARSTPSHILEPELVNGT